MKQYSLKQLAAIYATYKDLDPNTHIISCCTCGKRIHIEQVEDCYNLWGHYLARSISRKLIYHPQNSHCQCSECNIQNKGMLQSYDDYMIYRYGKNIKEKLLNSENKTEEYYYELYTNLLLELTWQFPELADIIINKLTGEVIYTQTTYANEIEQQFNTYSKTYKQDLDIICKTIGSEFIEYQRM